MWSTEAIEVTRSSDPAERRGEEAPRAGQHPGTPGCPGGSITDHVTGGQAASSPMPA